MKKLVIDNITGLVENCIKADSEFTIDGKTLIESIGQENIGDIYDFNNQTFSTPADSEQEIKDKAKADLLATDKNMARVGEDLIDTLISKGIISLTDLPQSAQNKINNRKALRDIISGA